MSIYNLGMENQQSGRLRVFWVIFIAIAAFAGCAHSPLLTTEPIEKGWIERSTLEGPAHQEFKFGYDTATAQAPFLPMLRTVNSGVETIVFLGTWCSDSRRHVPHFLKVADLTGLPAASIKLYCVDRSKKSDDGLTDSYKIEKVPTFIFQKNGKEIGRIIESPQLSMEQDMLTIFSQAEAKP